MSASRASEPRPSGRPSGDGGSGRRREELARPGARARGEEVLPADGLPCVWMSAGMLAWRLCDREYDCEHCPLDAALAGEHAPADAPGRDAERRLRLEFPADRLYCASHGWVQARETARVRLGLDALVGRLLDQVSAVVLPAVGSHTRRGEPLCWLVDDGVPVPLPSPVSGTVLATNPSVRADPGLIARAPYSDGWLLELEAAPDLEQRRKDLVAGSEQRCVTARQLRDLHRRGARLAARARERTTGH